MFVCLFSIEIQTVGRILTKVAVYVPNSYLHRFGTQIHTSQ